LIPPNPNDAPADGPEARQYNRIRRRLAVFDYLLGLAVLLVLLGTGWTQQLRDSAYLWAGQRYVLAVFLYFLMLTVLAKVLGIGLDYYGFRVEHQFHLSNQKLPSWLWDEAKDWFLGLVLGTVLVELLYSLIRLAPRYWWLLAWAAFLILFTGLAQIAPVVVFPLFYKFRPLQREDLRDRLTRLGERAATRVRGVYEWKLSQKSKKANAALTGLGKTRRIILSDTLLEQYSDDEIEAVLAHELGHHVHRHIPKNIFIQAVITLAGFWAAARILHYAVHLRHLFEEDYDFANLPLLILVATLLSLVALPAINAWMRYHERQADRYVFRSLPSVVPFITAMNKLARQNLAERSPSRLVEWLFHSHPSISKRIAAAEAWSQEHKAATP
jgi:STE24 endopeptidase